MLIFGPVGTFDTHPDLAAELGFQAQARDTVAVIRDAFAAAIEAICGGSPRARDVSDAFKIHRKLGWQVWNIAYAADAALAVRLMPTRHGMDVWLAAARRAGVPPELLERLERAAPLFDELLRTHAQDRGLFEMMVESSEPAIDEAAEQRWRKQAFTGNSFIFGVRARALLAAAFLHPSVRGGWFDMVRIQGLIGFIRTRPNVRWPFAQSIVESGPDDAQRLPAREPLMPAPPDAASGVPILATFCSRPLPGVQRRVGETGLLEDELLPGPVGQTGECTLFTGEILREVAPVYRTHEGEDAMFGTGSRTPAELLICDQFVHRDLFPGAARELRVYSELISPTTRDERDRLRVSETVHHLGRGIARIRTAELPNYAEIVRYVFSRTGWNADEFDVYRVRMRHPPVPASVMLRHELAAPPSADVN